MKIHPAKIQVRFADIDLMGHVNNAVYLSYFENTRMHYFKHMLGDDWDWNQFGIILLKNEIEYILPVRLNHEPMIHLYVEKIGNKSFTLGYKLEVNGELHCKGLSTLVGFDNVEQKTILIPPAMKEALQQLNSEQ